MTARATPAASSNLRLMAAGYVGNVLEWYDFAVYGFFAATIGTLFFPSEDHAASLIAAFGAFAAGFVMRPLGAILFGHIGDRYGRRRLLVVSALAMALSTFAIGLLPTERDIGWAAAVLMVGLRLVQGASVGGEYTGSGVFLAERAPAGRRGLYASFSAAGLMSGVLLGSAVGALVTSLLTEAEIAAWGWRLPFLAGLLLGAVALALRLSVGEARLPEARPRLPVAEAVARHGKEILLGTAVIMALAASWYITVIFVPGWWVRELGVPRQTALEINALNVALAIVAGLAAAALSDRIGRKPVLIAAALGYALLAVPMFLLMDQGDIAVIWAAQAVLGALGGCYSFVLPATLAEMFPWRVRATAANLSLNLSFAIFGGTGPMIAAWLVGATGGTTTVAVYMAAMGVLSAIACLFLTDRRRVPLD